MIRNLKIRCGTLSAFISILLIALWYSASMKEARFGGSFHFIPGTY